MNQFSIIVPVYNRPNEIKELLDSLENQTFTQFEVVIVEDGSTIKSEEIVNQSNLDISYYYKNNSGPGDSRNFGMSKAKGNYFIILDSDCILPKEYMQEVASSLDKDFVDCFGGVDTATEHFTDVQKAINFAMTSFLTTGGIRGGSEKLGKFQPRSFNMGISKKAFEASGGFGRIHPGEDPDLSIRLWKMGFETKLLKNAYVYHKRRIDWDKFKMQVNKFGKVRPILDSWHPEYRKVTFYFPTFFLLGFIFSLLACFFGMPYLMYMYCIYFCICFFTSSIQNKNLEVGFLSIWAVIIQFYGYGTGFLKSFFYIRLLKYEPTKVFPELFFKK